MDNQNPMTHGLLQALTTIPLEPAFSEETRECPACKGTIRPLPNLFAPSKGFVWPRCQCEIDAYTAKRKADELRDEQARIDRFFAAFSMPERFRDRTIGNFIPDAGSKEAFDTTSRFIETIDQRIAEGAGIWFTGKFGNGKTHLAASIYHAAREARITAVFVCVADLLAKLKTTYGDDATHSEWEYMGPLQSAKLLVLDDLGKEKPTDWARERLFIVVNHRYENRLSTIVTTNVDPGLLASRIGDATIDRLTGMCRYTEITSESRRWTEAPTW